MLNHLIRERALPKVRQCMSDGRKLKDLGTQLQETKVNVSSK